jgi:hypothetical protein
MYKYTPPRTNKTGLIIPLFLFAAAAICLLFSAIGLGNRLSLQLIAVICLTAGIQITTRYRLCSFTYIISERTKTDDMDPDTIGSSNGQDIGTISLSVIRTQGKYSRTVAVLPLSGIVDVLNTRAETKKKHTGIKHYYNFCANMYPQTSWIVVFIQDDKKTAINLEPDETILGYIIKQRKSDI